GALVIFGQESYDAPRAAIYPAAAKADDAPIVVEAKKATTCLLVPTFDGSVVARCGSGGSSNFFRISTKGFEPIFPDTPTDVTDASIDKDGALYLAFGHRAAVERCPAPNGKCAPIAVQKDARLP